MIKKVISAVVICGVLALVTIAPAFAQLPGTEMSARIPFDFIVRGKTFPAGTYGIKRVFDSPEGLIIQNRQMHSEHAVFETEPLESRKAPERAELVFHRYGDTYFLSQIWPGGDETGREIAPSHQERSLSKQLASNGTQQETVMVAAF
jgi:hypothetical protein